MNEILQNQDEFDSLLKFIKSTRQVPKFVILLLREPLDNYSNQLLLAQVLIQRKLYLMELLRFLSIDTKYFIKDRLTVLKDLLSILDLGNITVNFVNNIELHQNNNKQGQQQMEILLLLAQIVADLVLFPKHLNLDSKLLKIDLLNLIIQSTSIDVCVQFMPGILGSLVKNCWMDTLCHHKIVVKSLVLFGNIVEKCCNDQDYFIDNGSGDGKMVRRTREWYEITAKHLGQILGLLNSLKKGHLEVRMEYLKILFVLLFTCTKVFKEYLNDILEVVSYFWADDDDCRFKLFVESKMEILKLRDDWFEYKTFLEIQSRQDLLLLKENPSEQLLQKIVGMIGVLGDDSKSFLETFGSDVVGCFEVILLPDYNDLGILEQSGNNLGINDISHGKFW